MFLEIKDHTTDVHVEVTTPHPGTSILPANASQSTWRGRSCSHLCCCGNKQGSGTLMPTSRGDDADTISLGAIGSIGSSLILGAVIFCVSKGHCPDAAFSNWESNACLFKNSGAIIMITTGISCALAIILACSALSCCICFKKS